MNQQGPSGMSLLLIILGILGLWLVLQIWILPKLGVPT